MLNFYMDNYNKIKKSNESDSSMKRAFLILLYKFTQKLIYNIIHKQLIKN